MNTLLVWHLRHPLRSPSTAPEFAAVSVWSRRPIRRKESVLTPAKREIRFDRERQCHSCQCHESMGKMKSFSFSCLSQDQSDLVKIMIAEASLHYPGSVFCHWPLIKSSEVIWGQQTFLSIIFIEVDIETKKMDVHMFLWSRRIDCYMAWPIKVKGLSWPQGQLQTDLLRSSGTASDARWQGERDGAFTFIYLDKVRSCTQKRFSWKKHSFFSSD